MTEISQLDENITEVLKRLRASMEAREAALSVSPEDEDMRARCSALEKENVALNAELENLRTKRDKDVAALDELIAQLKPLIEEV